MSSGLTLTNNETEDIIKVVRPLRNRGILVKRISEKTKSQKIGFLGNALGSLMKVGLRLKCTLRSGILFWLLKAL